MSLMRNSYKRFNNDRKYHCRNRMRAENSVHWSNVSISLVFAVLATCSPVDSIVGCDCVRISRTMTIKNKIERKKK